jgi:hypothetical protein
MTCEVDLATKGIRFLGCEGYEAMTSAVDERIAQLTSRLDARSGLTNRERRALNRERNFLQKWKSGWRWDDGQKLAIERKLRRLDGDFVTVIESKQPGNVWSYRL